MFRRVLVANRGEIAVRIIRACRDLGVSPVTVHSEADRDSLHVRLADESFEVGGAASRDSYLNGERVIEAARAMEAEALHPGYGFLAENGDFAARCAERGLVFVGPPPEAMRRMGDKAAARETAVKAGVPVVPGSDIVSGKDAERAAATIGFPLLIKAAAGGGGMGMRLVRDPSGFSDSLREAQSEAEAAFGDARVFLERFVENPRHVEIQVFGDDSGSVVHLGERDCSIQRRNQKLLEESPSPAISPELRAGMGEAAVRLARGAGYRNAGTVEFLLDPEGRFHFLEMNARLQVEHPVTELVSGLDLVALQLRVAAGEPLGFAQSDVSLRGAAIELRITAEDPFAGFVPATGRIREFRPPRVRESGVTPGSFRGAWCRRTTTRCSPRSSFRGSTGKRPGNGRSGRSGKRDSSESPRPFPSSSGCWPAPRSAAGTSIPRSSPRTGPPSAGAERRANPRRGPNWGPWPSRRRRPSCGGAKGSNAHAAGAPPSRGASPASPKRIGAALGTVLNSCGASSRSTARRAGSKYAPTPTAAP